MQGLINAWRNLSLRRYVLLLTAITVLIELVMLNRFPFTSDGIQSFGRVWMFYISYADLGFTRRALVGTLLSETGISSLFSNEYNFAIALHHLLILLLTALVVRFILQQRITDKLLLATILLSPVFLIQSAYSTGTLDMPILILALLNLFYVRKWCLFSLILVVGIFIHELFVFTIPAQFLGLIIRKEIKLTTWRSLLPLLLPAAIALAALCIVTQYGQTTLPQADYEQIMAAKLPNAAYKHDLWSGYFEVTTNLDQNIRYTKNMTRPLGENLHYIAIPVLYMLLVLARTLMFARGYALKALVLIAATTPLATYLVGMDFYRWVSLTDNMAFALTLLLAARTPRPTPRWLNYMLLACILLGPFAPIMIDQPFPMYHLLFKKLGISF